MKKNNGVASDPYYLDIEVRMLPCELLAGNAVGNFDKKFGTFRFSCITYGYG